MAVAYAVGVGPGDPELVTRKAERILRAADLIVAPVSRAGEPSVALETVRSFLDDRRQQILQLPFPMTPDRDQLVDAWRTAAGVIADNVASGRDVAFITIGDPLFYSTFIYLLGILRSEWPGVPVEIVPGITSFCASAAAGSVPLVEADECFAVIPATAGIERIIEALSRFDTVVLLKVRPLFGDILEMLRQTGRTGTTLFAERVGSERQLILTDFEQIAAHVPDYLSLMVVRRSPAPGASFHS